MTCQPNAETIEAMEAARRGEFIGSFNSTDELLAALNREEEDKFPGWLTLLIWLGLGTLSWVPIIALIYLMW